MTFEELARSTDTLAKNARALSAEVKRREAVLEGIAPAHEAPAAVNPIVWKEAAPLSAERIFLKELEEKNMQMTVMETYGPIAYQLSAFDDVPTFHTFYIYLGKGKGGRTALRVMLADTHYFVDLRSGAEFIDKKTLFGPLIECNIPYWFQGVTHFYCTRDVSYYADLATVIDRIRRPSLDAHAIQSQKSSLLDLLLWNGVHMATMLLGQSKVFRALGRPQRPISHLLVGRSHASLYYLSFNRSVWRIPEKPFFPGTQFGSAKSSHVEFEAIRSSVTPQMLETIFQGAKIRREAWDNLLRAG